MVQSILFPSTDVQDLDSTVRELLNHPDFRSISTFFLGWAFFSSLHHVQDSVFMRIQVRRCKGLFAHAHSGGRPVTAMEAGQEHTEYLADRKHDPWYTRNADSIERLRREESATLTFLLSVSFGIASLSQFFSLLSFGPGQTSETSCAFVIAFGDIASQGARIIGLLLLGFELRRRHVVRWEFWLILICLVIVFALVFGDIAAGIGLVYRVAPSSVFVCFRKLYLPTSLPMSLITIILEVYLIVRFILLSAPRHLAFAALEDVHLVQAGSLLLLDILTIVPNSTKTNTLAQYIPFSIGAILVLAAFNARKHTPLPVVHMGIPAARSFLDMRPTIPSAANTTAAPRPLASFHNFSSAIQNDSNESRSWRPTSGISAISTSSHVDSESADHAVQPDVRRPVKLHFPPSNTENDLGSSFPSSSQASASNIQQRIMPFQAQFAESLETHPQPEGLPIRSRPKITVNVELLSSTPSPSAADTASTRPGNTLLSARSPGSTIFGSDIIRIASRKDRTKGRGAPSARTPSLYSRRSMVSSSSRSFRHQSWTTIPDMPDRLPDIFEASNDPHVPRTPTFGRRSILTQISPGELLFPPPPPLRYMEEPSPSPSHPRFKSDGIGSVKGPRPLPRPL